MVRNYTDYFGRWAQNRRVVSRIISALESGRTVYLHQYASATKLTKKHLGMVKAGPDGIYVLHGKNWLCNPTGTRVTSN